VVFCLYCSTKFVIITKLFHQVIMTEGVVWVFVMTVLIAAQSC